MMSSRARAALALTLIAPAPSVGILVAFVFEQGPLGAALWGAAKVWLFGLPVAWWLWVEKQPLSLSPVKRGGWGMAWLTGLVMGGGIVGGYLLLGRPYINPQLLRDKLEPLGLSNPWVYIAGAAYWILINSVLEEYVFRWFVFRQCEVLLGGKRAMWAVAASGLVFTVHHTIAMGAYFPWWINAAASAAIFLAGAVWSWMYLRYRSVWIPYISHAIADLAIFVLGYRILFPIQ